MKRQEVTAKDITGPGLQGSPKKLIDIAWKYARVLGLHSIPPLVVRNNLSSHWLGRCHLRYRTPSPGVYEKLHLIEIQKRVMHDDRSLERIVAHEMAHYADHLTVPDKELSIMRIVKRPGHGPSWQRFADQINRVMGKDFVTEKSDETVLLAPETKPYVLLIVKMAGGERFAYALGMRFTPKMKRSVYHYGDPPWIGRLAQTTDPRWAHGPRIGGGKLAVPHDPQAQKMLEGLYEKGVPIKA